MHGLAYAARAGMFLAAGLLITIAGCKSGSKGQQQTDKLSDSVMEFEESVKKAKQELNETLAAYDAVVNNQPGDDLRTPYGKFTKGIEKLDKRRERIRKHVDKMQGIATTYFAQWQAQLAGITDDDLRGQSQDRLDETRDRFNEIDKEGKDAKEHYQPLIASLRDQAVYLDRDLNATSASSLKPKAKDVKKMAKEVNGDIDAVIKASSGYRKSVAMRVKPEPEKKNTEACGCGCGCGCGDKK